MRNVLIDYYDNIKKAYALNFPIPKGIIVYNGKWHFDNYIKYKVDEFIFRISYEHGVFGEYQVEIMVDDIVVYKDRWIHKIPKKMMQKIKAIVKELKAFNKKCKKNKIDKSYKEMKKQQELKRKQEEIEKYEDEKKRLIKKFL